jgi:hypothetical protein
MQGLVLPPTEGDHKIAIKEAIDRLEAGGSTAGGGGYPACVPGGTEELQQ